MTLSDSSLSSWLRPRTLVCKIVALLTVCALAAVPTLAEVIEDQCFEVSWGPLSSPYYRVVQPVSEFPSTHALVQNTVCGQTFSTGDPIPATGLWSESGATLASDPSCRTVRAGELFYAYNFPDQFASNTGLNEVSTELFYFIHDTGGHVNLVVVHDKIGNPTGGNAKMYLDAADLQNRGVGLTFFDDVNAQNYSYPGAFYGACANPPLQTPADCHSWSEALGQGYFYWKWNKNAADGMALGPLPDVGTYDYAFSVSYLQLSGITNFRVGDWDAVNDVMGYVSLNSSDIQSGIRFRAMPCSGPTGVFAPSPLSVPHVREYATF